MLSDGELLPHTSTLHQHFRANVRVRHHVCCRGGLEFAALTLAVEQVLPPVVGADVRRNSRHPILPSPHRATNRGTPGCEHGLLSGASRARSRGLKHAAGIDDTPGQDRTGDLQRVRLTS